MSSAGKTHVIFEIHGQAPALDTTCCAPGCFNAGFGVFQPLVQTARRIFSQYWHSFEYRRIPSPFSRSNPTFSTLRIQRYSTVRCIFENEWLRFENNRPFSTPVINRIQLSNPENRGINLLFNLFLKSWGLFSMFSTFCELHVENFRLSLVIHFSILNELLNKL